MNKMTIVFISTVVFVSGCKHPVALPQEKTDPPPKQEIVKPRSPWPVLEPHPTDPSREPMMLDGEFFSQWRVIADFDGNGTLDIGVSEGEPADCSLVLYLRTPEGYKNSGDLNIRAGGLLSIEHVDPPTFSRLWSSGHISSSESGISYDELKDGLIVTNSRPNCFVISWGANEENKLPDALDNAIFRNSSTPIWWEKSVFTNGVFKWVPFRADIP
jgi:hypothetical protein